jgi:dTMP kinase
MFFSFDGVDGAGKSTQAALFRDWLVQQGYRVVACRDPGSTPLGERIREVLLTANAEWQIDLRSEMFLYMAARSQLVEEVIRPALAAGQVIVADRFLLANIVYQGHAGGLGGELVRQVGEICTAGVQPDCIFLLDLSPEQARRRLDRDLDRMEQRGLDFQRRIREGFLIEAAASSDRVHVVDAGRPMDVLQLEIQMLARNYLARETSAATATLQR